MTIITTAQLKTTIVAGFATDSITNVPVFDFPRVEKRRKFPSVEINAVEPEGTEADPRITNISQRFDIQLRVRKRGGGSDEIAQQKSIENSIIKSLDATALGQSKIFVLNKVWSRPGGLVAKPVPHMLSTLIALVTEPTSTTGAGQVILQMTVDFPSLAGMPLLNKPVARETEAYESIYNDTRDRKALGPTGDTRVEFFEVEYTDARMSQLRTTKATRAATTVTINRPSGAEVLTGRIADLSHGGDIGGVETITITYEVL